MEHNIGTHHETAAAPLVPQLLSGEGEGSPLFVINLCASMTPSQLTSKTLPGLEAYRLYQVSRREDGRTRYRLRLGFFTSEADAEAVLATVRSDYPTAFTTCLGADEQRFTKGYVPARPQPRPVPTPAAQPEAVDRATSEPAPTQNGAPTAAKAEVIELTWEPERPTASAPQPRVNRARPGMDDVGEVEISWEPTQPAPDTPTPPTAVELTLANDVDANTSHITRGAPKRDEVQLTPSASATELKLAADAPPPQASSTATSNAPFHVGKGAHIPDVDLGFATQPPAERTKTPPVLNTTPVRKPAAPAAASTQPRPPQVKARSDAGPPELDSTQTIRALTSTELNDDSQEQWFAIELAVSEQAVNLDTMPHLDIFEAYRLYSVAAAANGKITHSLRLGFFREAVSAEAVSGYLKTFFAAPNVIRVSVAEQLRFRDTPKRKSDAAKSEANVIELKTRERPIHPIPTVTAQPNPAAPGSFKPNSTGSFKPTATGTFRAQDTGSFKPNATGAHGAMKSAAKSAVATRSEAVKGPAGKYKVPPRKLSLDEQLLEAARDEELSASGIRKLPKSNSLLARLVGKLTK